MTLKEKCDAFAKVVMAEAEKMRYTLMTDGEQRLADACREAEEAAKAELSAVLAKERQKLNHLHHKVIAEAEGAARQRLAGLRTQLLRDLRTDVLCLLDDYIKTEAYEKALCEAINLCSQAYGPMDVTLTAHGGFNAVLTGGRIRLVHSFETRLQEVMARFSEF